MFLVTIRAEQRAFYAAAQAVMGRKQPYKVIEKAHVVIIVL
jgi:hypothetical protein